MQTTIPQMKGYVPYEYKVVINPHQDLMNKIIAVRKSFDETYKTDLPIKSVPEVLLCTFTQYKAIEQRILHRLRLISMAVPAVKVEIRNFGTFPTHTIYLDVTTKVPLGNLVKKIRQEAGHLMKQDSDNKPHFITESFYIPVARKLKPWQHEKGWLEYGNKHFTSTFIAKNLIILSRKKGEFNYKPIARYEFLNQPIETKQGELF